MHLLPVNHSLKDTNFESNSNWFRGNEASFDPCESSLKIQFWKQFNNHYELIYIIIHPCESSSLKIQFWKQFTTICSCYVAQAHLWIISWYNFESNSQQETWKMAQGVYLWIHLLRYNFWKQFTTKLNFFFIIHIVPVNHLLRYNFESNSQLFVASTNKYISLWIILLCRYNFFESNSQLS